MSAQSVFETVSSVIACTHQAWPEGSAPPLPWAVYLSMGDNGFFADDRKHAAVERWCVELYQSVHDDELEDNLESALEQVFGAIDRGAETWIDDENCSVMPFYFTAID